MPYVRPRTKQNCKLSFLLLLSVLTTVLLPMAGGTLRWMVVATSSRNVINNEITIDSYSEKEIGLFKTCDATPWEATCADNEYPREVRHTDGCHRDGTQYANRVRATAGFTLMAFFTSIPLLVLSIFHFRLSLFVDEERVLDLIAVKVTMSRRRGLLLRMIFSGITGFFVFIAVCVYGDTMGRWIGCGEHYCSGMLKKMERQASNLNPTKTAIHQDIDVNCGFGFSFATIIACFFMMFAFMIIVLVDFLMKPPKQAPLQRPPQSDPTREDAIANETMELSTPHKQTVQHKEGRQTGVPQQQHQSFIVNSSQASPKLLPEGDDWEFDADENLYWSPSQELFFDEASGHFYDPESASWFNPQTQKWYKM